MKKLFLILIVLFYVNPLMAFVQTVSMGYPSCVACHVAPTGGGLINVYGRALSDNQLSTWSLGDAFAQPFFGTVSRSPNLKWGGDIRMIQANINNKSVDSGKFFLMQQNIEAGYTLGKVTFVGTIGTLEGPVGTQKRGQFLSERHYAIWSPTPMSRVRIGKFRQAFGIYTDNHARLVKNSFGFGSYSETYNMEYTQFFDDYELAFNTSLGRIDNPQAADTEKNFSGHFTHYLGGHSRLGVSVLLGESNLKRRSLSGINGIVPISDNWLTLFEVDYERSHLTSQPQNGVDTLASLLRVGYLPIKGVMTYFVFEHLSRDDGTNYRLIHQPGLGIQWLPVAHFNFQFEYLRQVNELDPGNPNNIAFALFHFYL